MIWRKKLLGLTASWAALAVAGDLEGAAGEAGVELMVLILDVTPCASRTGRLRLETILPLAGYALAVFGALNQGRVNSC